MSTWILTGAVLLCVWATRALRGERDANPTQDLQAFVDALTAQIHAQGPDYLVRGIVPGTFTMILCIRGQEVPVPLDNVHRHYVTFPDQLPEVARQLLSEIEEVGLETPTDQVFVDAAMRVLPQICRLDWVYENGPAFGDSSIVHRDLGSNLAICYVIDDPWSVVFVCQAHLNFWERTEEDIFHLANQNLRRMSTVDMPVPSATDGPVRVGEGDGYDAARVLLLDPDKAAGLLIAIPERDSLYLGCETHRKSLSKLMTAGETADHPVSRELFRIEGQALVPVSEPNLE